MAEIAPDDWTELTSTVRPTFTRTMGRFHLEVERKSAGWWVVEVWGNSGAPVFTKDGPSLMSTARKGELWAKYRPDGGV